LLTLAAAATVVAAACGGDDDSTNSTSGNSGAERTVEVKMVDNAFEPDVLKVSVGESVHFVFDNTGKVAHDAFVGDAAAQMDHEDEMRAADESSGGEMDTHMGSGGEEGEGITVEPGDTGDLTHTFDKPGTLEIGCHEPGHYDSGMKVAITVS
jgi:uncharacterized cupredoxin-like copper-binding protein